MEIVRYDPQVDALYIDLSDDIRRKEQENGVAPPVFDTQERQEGVLVDLDESGNVIGVEILDFRHRLGGEGSFLLGQEVASGKEA